MSDLKVEVLGSLVEDHGTNRLRILGYADKRMDAVHELWRRAKCNGCVVMQASMDAAGPADLRGAKPITGREYSFQERYVAWTTDTNYLWLATDCAIQQIDLARGILIKEYGLSAGLPDNRPYQLAGDGSTLWVAYRGGVAALDIARGVIRDLPALKSEYARIHIASNATWVIADTGTFRFGQPDKSPDAFPPIPTAGRIRDRVRKGVWTPQWTRRTNYLIGGSLTMGQRLYAVSYGGVYELFNGRWTSIAARGFDLVEDAGRLWFMTPDGIGEHRPDTGETIYHSPPAFKRGAFARMILVDHSLWAVADPLLAADGTTVEGGGVARLDTVTGKWQAWSEINGSDARHVGCIREGDNAVWTLNMLGAYRAMPVHPGMMLATSGIFEPSGFTLNRFDRARKEWSTMRLPMERLERRLVCGQRGECAEADIRPHAMDLVSAGSNRVFAVARLMPEGYAGAYWPSVLQVASRSETNPAWSAGMTHHPGELNLQGEQPMTLNISGACLLKVGEYLREAVGHDNILGMFQDRQRHWVVTEGCAAYFDEAAGQWRKAAETGYRYYWRATAAVDDGQFLTIGSDRGLISRLDIRKGTFQIVAGLKDRTIAGMTLQGTHEVAVRGGDAPLGAMPTQFRMPGAVFDADRVKFDGKAWTAVDEGTALAPQAEKPGWSFRPVEPQNVIEETDGNFLVGPARYYVKEVFYPRFLCASPDGKRLWISTFTGLLRLDLPEGK